MIVALTSASLDITLGVAWWTLKQVFSGAVYLGSYLFSESSASKRNKILGDDINFVPYAFPIVELEVAHSHTTVNKTTDADNSTNSEEFVEISKTDCILTTRDKYFSIPTAEIIKRSGELPLWIVPFLNTYPLANYAITKNDTTGNFSISHNDTPIFSPFTLHQHLFITLPVPPNLCVFLNHNDVETTITLLTNTLK